MRKALYTLVLTTSAMLALSACSALDLTPEPKSNEAAAPADAGAAADAGAGAAPEEGTPTTGPTTGPTATGGSLVKAVQATIGTIVTTGAGLPLYRWDKDAPGTPTCYDTCAAKFTAYPYTDDLAVEGVAEKLVGKVRRKDGSVQLTINDWPVYTNVNDQAGTYKAHGQNNAWWLIGPDGGKLPAPKK